MREVDGVLPGNAVGGLVGEPVGRCVGVALAGSGEGRETVTVTVGNVTGLVGYRVDDGSGEGVNVAGICCRLDNGSGESVVVNAMAGESAVGKGVMTV